ncbi:hypothetical protein TNCV_1512471 [Trichonephila clavipes]|nr:hypothetical protein TNCV_1512471 [Trichonephila clavipes]
MVVGHTSGVQCARVILTSHNKATPALLVTDLVTMSYDHVTMTPLQSITQLQREDIEPRKTLRITNSIFYKVDLLNHQDSSPRHSDPEFVTITTRLPRLHQRRPIKSQTCLVRDQLRIKAREPSVYLAQHIV